MRERLVPVRAVVITGDLAVPDRLALQAMGVPVLVMPVPPQVLLRHLGEAVANE